MTISVRGIVFGVTTLVLAGALVLQSAITLNSQLGSSKKQQIENIEILTAILVEQLPEVVNNRDKLNANRILSPLAKTKHLTHVHVYLAQNNIAPLLAKYQKKGALTIENQVQLLANYNTPKFSEQRVEYARPIYYADHIVGYLYIRAEIDNFNSKALLKAFSLILLLLAIAMCILFMLSSKISAPLNEITGQLTDIVNTRDYSMRTNSASITELNALSHILNLMMSRIEEYTAQKQETEKQYKQLNTRLESEIEDRTLALKVANNELIQTLEKLHQFQRQIVQNEKMASLGDMVAGVAHEVNTPIGLGITASTMMLDNVAKIQNDFKNKTLKASSMAQFLEDSEESLNIIYRNLHRAAELISKFKQVAVDQSSDESRELNPAELFDEILLSMKPKLKKVDHKVTVLCDKELIVKTKAGPITQILINLIMNSILHGFENIKQGEIIITAEVKKPNNLKLKYQDNGVGIPKDMLKRIFDPFVTSKRGSGGSGLGMHLVYNLVTQALGGSITASSQKGKGAEFTIIFPVEIKKSE